MCRNSSKNWLLWMRSVLYETEFENKETSQFDAAMGKRNNRYTTWEHLSDVVLNLRKSRRF